MKKIFLIAIFVFFTLFSDSSFAQDFVWQWSLTPKLSIEKQSTPNTSESKNLQNSESSRGENLDFSNHFSCVKNPEIRVFMYHYIRYADFHESKMLHELSVPPETFDAHLETVERLAREKKIALMTGEDFVNAMKNNCFPHEKIWIFTADDGWEDNYYSLAPIATKHQIPFIFGIVSGAIGKQNFINQAQLKELSENPLFTIASHTITHPKLNYGSLHKAKSEICDSKKQLEKIIEKPVEIMIYPYGIMGKNTIRFAKECNYSLAWSTNFGEFLNWKKPNFFNMNRIHISPNTKTDFFENLAK